MKFDEVIQLQVLKLKASTRGLPGHLIDQAIDQGSLPSLRQMCAKVHPETYDRLENVCGLLNMSKREFIESAVTDALHRAEVVIERSGVISQEGI
jgi:hypothetical protein